MSNTESWQKPLRKCAMWTECAGRQEATHPILRILCKDFVSDDEDFPCAQVSLLRGHGK